MATRPQQDLAPRVLHLREQAMSYREIGRELGISHETARRLARDNGVTTLTATPAALGARGQAFWDHAHATLNLDKHEVELLTQVCRLLDLCDTLQALVTAEGVTTTSATGIVRAHPAVAELRQTSLAVGRLVAQLAIPGEDDEPAKPNPGWSRRARHAASRRWDAEARKYATGGPHGVA